MCIPLLVRLLALRSSSDRDQAEMRNTHSCCFGHLQTLWMKRLTMTQNINRFQTCGLHWIYWKKRCLNRSLLKGSLFGILGAALTATAAGGDLGMVGLYQNCSNLFGLNKMDRNCRFGLKLVVSRFSCQILSEQSRKP